MQDLNTALHERRKLVSPTYLENWPAELHALSIPSTSFVLSEPQQRAMLAVFWSRDDEEPPESVLGGMTGGEVKDAIGAIRTTITATLADSELYPAFIRLGSRSPKDAWMGYSEGFAIKDGEKGMRLLFDSMERIWDDLSLDHETGAQTHVWLRQWVDIPKWAEFRCVLRNKSFVGASQYEYAKGVEFPEIIDRADAILDALTQFADRVATACHLDDVVFDIGFLDGDLTRPVLIEINPFGDLTDQCLYRHHGWPEAGAAPELIYFGDGRDHQFTKKPPTFR